MSSAPPDEEDVSTTQRTVVGDSTEPSLAPPERRPSSRPRRKSGATQDTLLSAPTDPDDDIELRDPRVGDLERRFEQLEARVKVLEMTGVSSASWVKGLVWVGLLVALAAVALLTRR